MSDVATELRDFIAREFLEGQDVGLDEATPLFDLGVIDSMSIVLLQRFVQEKFGVVIPPASLTPAHLATIGAMCRLIESLRPPP